MSYLIAGNWKMNGTQAFATGLVSALAARAQSEAVMLAARKVEVALCPPAPLLSVVASALAGSAVALGGQDCHAENSGAHTGDISALLLADLGCRYVIVGHSERRADHGETDAMVRAKAEAAVRAGLIPIVCVGETEAERDRGQTEGVIARQIRGSIPGDANAGIVIAYEPVWAIGTGKTATHEDIIAVHAHIRALCAAAGRNAQALRILYGGSVKAANAAGILRCRGVNGALVGGASLDLGDFWTIVEACPADRTA